MFSFPEPEVSDSVQKVPNQLDVTLAPSAAEEVPLVGKDVESKEVKPDAKPKSKEKPDFLTVLRDNNLEVFAKELVTNDTSDEEFANQLISDKHFGENSYPNEIDFNEYEYYPKHVSEKIEKS